MSSKPAKKNKGGAPRKDPPGLYQWPLGEEYWDFRAVDPEDVPLVAFYEYAASCDWIRRCWKKWAARAFPSWKRKWHSEEFSSIEWDTGKTVPIAKVLNGLVKQGINVTDSDEVVQRLLGTVPEPLQHGVATMIIYEAPDFPTPWLKLDPNSRKRLRSRWQRSCQKSEAFTVFDPTEPVALYREDPANENAIFEVAINWKKRETEILDSFRRWLSEAYNVHGKNLKKKAAHSDAYNRLRWLSAWRLHRSGLQFQKAQQALRRQVHRRPSTIVNHDLPLVPKGTWDNSLTKARHFCDFLFPSPT